MRHLIIYLLLLTLFYNTTYAQEKLRTDGYVNFKDYEWSSSFTRPQLTREDSAEPLIYQKYLTAHEFRYDNSGNLRFYLTRHYIVILNSNDAVEAFNKLTFAMEDVYKIEKLQVRSMTPTGEEINLDTSQMKYIANLENEGPHKLLAIDGLQLGSTLEVVYTLEENYRNYIRGVTETVQSRYIKRNYNFVLRVPENLKFRVKSYNDLGKPEQEEDGKYVIYRINEKLISPLKEEQYTAYKANLKKVTYIYLRNSAAKTADDFTTWQSISEIFSEIYQKYDKTVAKKIKKLAKEGNIKTDTYLDMINLERYLKKKFILQNISDDQFSELSKVLKTKQVNSRGMIKLFCQVFNYFKIPYELCISTNRLEEKFDPSFPSFRQLDIWYLYIPALNYYICPADRQVGNGWLPSEKANNNALCLYFQHKEEGDERRHNLRFIPAIPAVINHDDLYIDCNLDGSFNDVKFTVKRTLRGEDITLIQTYWNELTEEQKANLFDSYLKITGENCRYYNQTILNETENQKDHFPFTFSGTVTDRSLFEKAGTKYFFKVGTLIGPQSELYNKEQRQNPVELNSSHGYHRVISFNIPEGYSITNLNDINFNVVMEIEGNPACYFKSSYKVEGNTVTITCDEEYLKIDIPVSRYEEFRKVINAAADFNKVKFILVKK